MFNLLFVGNFGVALRKEADGSFTGMKTCMFNYSGKWLVSFESYDRLLVELATKWDLNHKRDKLAKKFPPALPDSALKLEAFVHELVCAHNMHIKHFIDHLIVEGNRIFAGTDTSDTWCLYSDGLIQFWTPLTQAYIVSIGFGDRIWRAEGETNRGNRYKRKVTGNSPEVNVGTDNDGFRDLGVSMAFHVGLSFLYKVGDERRFSLGSIPEIAHTMKR